MESENGICQAKLIGNTRLSLYGFRSPALNNFLLPVFITFWEIRYYFNSGDKIPINKILSKKGVRMRKSLAITLLAGLIFASVAGGPEHMQNATAPQTIERDSTQAVIVFHTNTNFHIKPLKPLYDYFIDDQMVGQTKFNSYFIVHAAPGTRWIYLTIGGKVYNTARLELEANKIYYILEKAVPGGQILLSQTPELFAQYLKEVNPQYLVFKPAGETKKIKENRLADARKEFEEDVAKDPARHEDMLKYKGF